VTATATSDLARRPGRLRLLRSLLVLPVAVALFWFVALALENALDVDSAAFENVGFWIALAIPAISTYGNARDRAVQREAALLLVLATLLWTAVLLLLAIVFAGSS
jgi:hypothetical protein